MNQKTWVSNFSHSMRLGACSWFSVGIFQNRRIFSSLSNRRSGPMFIIINIGWVISMHGLPSSLRWCGWRVGVSNNYHCRISGLELFETLLSFTIIIVSFQWLSRSLWCAVFSHELNKSIIVVFFSWDDIDFVLHYEYIQWRS